MQLREKSEAIPLVLDITKEIPLVLDNEKEWALDKGKKFALVLDKFELGEADVLDVAIAMLDTIDNCHVQEIHTRARILLELSKSIKRPVGKPKTAPIALIKKLRSEGKTQEAIAQEAGVSLSTVRRALKN